MPIRRRQGTTRESDESWFTKRDGQARTRWPVKSSLLDMYVYYVRVLVYLIEVEII